MFEILQRLLVFEQDVIALHTTQKHYHRVLYGDITLDHKLIGIVGLRGVGKSTFLLSQKIQTPDSLYLSGDFFDLRTANLYDIVRKFYKEDGITTFYIDEVHFINNREIYLKTIYDSLPVTIIFSGSSRIDITRGSTDLSRRALIYTMPTFSYREFLAIEHNIILPRYLLPDILQHYKDISHTHFQQHQPGWFHTYLQQGQFGYYRESKQNMRAKLQASINKLIFEDIIRFVDLSSQKLLSIQNMILYLAQTGTSDISVHRLAKKIHLSPTTTLNYLTILEDAGLLDILRHYGSVSTQLNNQKKLFFSNTNILSLYPHDIGLMRETFVNMSLQHMSTTPKHLSTLQVWHEKKIDFVIQFDTTSTPYFLEVGGKHKKRKKHVITTKDDILLGTEKEMPLRVLGLL